MVHLLPDEVVGVVRGVLARLDRWKVFVSPRRSSSRRIRIPSDIVSPFCLHLS